MRFPASMTMPPIMIRNSPGDLIPCSLTRIKKRRTVRTMISAARILGKTIHQSVVYRKTTDPSVRVTGVGGLRKTPLTVPGIIASVPRRLAQSGPFFFLSDIVFTK